MIPPGAKGLSALQTPAAVHVPKGLSALPTAPRRDPAPSPCGAARRQIVTSPLLGLVVAFFAMTGLMWLVRRWRPAKVNNRFRRLQAISAAWMAFTNGRNDAQDAMGVITLALLSYGAILEFDVPLWVMFASATAIAAAIMGVGPVQRRSAGRWGGRAAHRHDP